MNVFPNSLNSFKLICTCFLRQGNPEMWSYINATDEWSKREKRNCPIITHPGRGEKEGVSFHCWHFHFQKLNSTLWYIFSVFDYHLFYVCIFTFLPGPFTFLREFQISRHVHSIWACEKIALVSRIVFEQKPVEGGSAHKWNERRKKTMGRGCKDWSTRTTRKHVHEILQHRDYSPPCSLSS